MVEESLDEIGQMEEPENELDKSSILWEREEVKIEEETSLTIVGDVLSSREAERDVEVSGTLGKRENRKKNREDGASCVEEIFWYDCDRCAIKFPLESMLNRHRMSHGYVGATRKVKKTSLSKESKGLDLERKDEGKGEDLKVLEMGDPTRLHVCNFCDFICETRSTLTSHLASDHDIVIVPETTRLKYEVCNVDLSHPSEEPAEEKREETFFCDLCNFSCKKRGTLRSHENKKHRGESRRMDDSEIKLEFDCGELGLTQNEQTQSRTVYSCNSCSFESGNKRTLSSHKRRQHAIEPKDEIYFCNECNFKTEKKTTLYSHIKRKHESSSNPADERPELFACSQCDYKNKNKYELKVHVARKHTDDFKFTCDICTKKFKVKGDLTNHVRFSHREQPIICDVCGKTCLNSNSLYVHQKFAHYKAKYECLVCKRRMVSQENLDEHMLRQHEKRESVVCEECGKTFSRNSRLKIHMRIHTGDRPYNCQVCNKTFARRTALKQHLLIHTGIRPYVCDVCGKAFTQKPGLISHRKSHPGPLPPLPRVRIDHILNDALGPDS